MKDVEGSNEEQTSACNAPSSIFLRGEGFRLCQIDMSYHYNQPRTASYSDQPNHSRSDSFPPPSQQDYSYHNKDRGYSHDDDNDDDDHDGAGFNTFSDFNNSNRRQSNNRLSTYADLPASKSTTSTLFLNSHTPAPLLSTQDWDRGEGAQELEAKALRRRTLISAEKKSRTCWDLATGQGRWKRLVFAVFAFLCV